MYYGIVINQKGQAGLLKKKNIKADYALKRETVLDIEENHLTFHEASLKNGACPQRISVWLLQYRMGGLTVLNSTKRRGRPPGMGRPGKNSKPPTELERLRKEVQELKTENALLKKSKSLSRGKECPATKDGARAIEELRHDEHPLQFMPHWVEMVRSVFYYHMSHMDDGDEYDGIRERIKQIYDKNHGRYGYRRICMELRNEDTVINHKTVRKLMNQMGLKAKTKKRHCHSYKGEMGKVALNVPERDFCADRSHRKWAADVTRVCINDRKLYLPPISDMFDGGIISFTIFTDQNLQMVISMLKKAFKKYPQLNTLTLHSDQGQHYQHGTYRKMLKDHDITQSMSRKGNCPDNAMIENFFGLMKN